MAVTVFNSKRPDLRKLMSLLSEPVLGHLQTEDAHCTTTTTPPRAERSGLNQIFNYRQYGMSFRFHVRCYSQDQLSSASHHFDRSTFVAGGLNKMPCIWFHQVCYITHQLVLSSSVLLLRIILTATVFYSNLRILKYVYLLCVCMKCSYVIGKYIFIYFGNSYSCCILQ